MKIEIGKYYVTKNKSVVRITWHDSFAAWAISGKVLTGPKAGMICCWDEYKDKIVNTHDMSKTDYQIVAEIDPKEYPEYFI